MASLIIFWQIKRLKAKSGTSAATYELMDSILTDLTKIQLNSEIAKNLEVPWKNWSH